VAYNSACVLLGYHLIAKRWSEIPCAAVKEIGAVELIFKETKVCNILSVSPKHCKC
jgi:hypothetical protein